MYIDYTSPVNNLKLRRLTKIPLLHSCLLETISLCRKEGRMQLIGRVNKWRKGMGECLEVNGRRMSWWVITIKVFWLVILEVNSCCVFALSVTHSQLFRSGRDYNSYNSVADTLFISLLKANVTWNRRTHYPNHTLWDIHRSFGFHHQVVALP